MIRTERAVLDGLIAAAASVVIAFGIFLLSTSDSGPAAGPLPSPIVIDDGQAAPSKASPVSPPVPAPTSVPQPVPTPTPDTGGGGQVPPPPAGGGGGGDDDDDSGGDDVGGGDD